MKKIPNWIIALIVILIIISSKFIFFPKKEDNSLINKKNNKGPVAVNYFVVHTTNFDNNVFTNGKIVSLNQIDIVSEVNGKVTAIYFKEGEIVNKGSVLLKLNDADLQAQLLKIKTQIQLSELKLNRLNKLFEINGISQEELDIQKNELSLLKSDQAYVLAQLAKTTIIAPFTGVVGLKNISEGSYVNTSTSIVSLVQLNPLYIEFSVPEKYNFILKKGILIKFLTESNTDTCEATVYAIEPKIDEATKTIKARAMYEGSKQLYPGAFVKVFANLKDIQNTIMIPTQCVIPTLKGQKVFVVKNRMSVEVMVKLGVRTDEKVQIIEGLQPFDTVITTGLLGLKKDMNLKLLKSVN